MPKKKYDKKKTGTNFDLTTDWKTFEISIFQLIAKILPKQKSLYQIRHCLRGHKQI